MRHFVKKSRWQVVSCPSYGFMRGTWLPTTEAKRMLRDGDFYPDGTCLMLYPEQVKAYVKGTELFTDAEFTELIDVNLPTFK